MTNFKSIKNVDKTRLYKVYHIRELGCTNTSDGYIGITKNSLSFRLTQHSTSKRPVGTKIRTLGLDKVEIVKLAELPFDEAVQMEAELRPSMHMGWNFMAGGCKQTYKANKTGVDTKFKRNVKPHNYNTGKKVRLFSPSGEVFEPVNLNEFCEEVGLVRQNVHKVCRGLRKHTKQWTAIYV